MSTRVPELSALETAFPAIMLSEVATHESWRKEVHRPATSTHKWWAKRLGTVFRGIIVAAMTPAGTDAAAVYASPFDLEGAVIFDPFSGSGITGVEALKMGARSICFDINPVATLVERQAVQPWDKGKLDEAYQKVENACRSEIDRMHLTEDGRTVLYYFWVAVVVCPECGARVRLFDTPIFSRHAYPKRVPTAQIVCPTCLDVKESRIGFEREMCANGHDIAPKGVVHGSKATCSNGHSFKIISALGDQLPEYEMFAKMVSNRDQSKSYEPITDWDRLLYAECEKRVDELPDSAVLPVGALEPGNNTNQALRWNFREWRSFFNARQLFSLSLIATAIRELPNSPEREALCTLFSGMLEFNNLFTSFKGEGTGAVRHMFSHHILKPERTPLEAHPWGTPQSSGAFSTLLKSRLYRASEYKKSPVDLVQRFSLMPGISNDVDRAAHLSQQIAAQIATSWEKFACCEGQVAYITTKDSAHTDLPTGSVDLVVTDPPYMDNVYYAELADFFHAWLRSMAPFEGYPTAFTTRVAGEVQNADPIAFGKAIESVWIECNRALKAGGLLAFTFHQAKMAGWVQLVESLRRAGFIITAVQPVKGEMATSIVKNGSSEPSNLDSVVVCRRSNDGATSHYSSLAEAVEGARERLGVLRDTGITVGAGDVRSVVRGTLLAYLASTGERLEEDILKQVDNLASETIALFFTEDTDCQ